MPTSARAPGGARLDDVGRDAGDEASKGRPALLAVSADIDVNVSSHEPPAFCCSEIRVSSWMALSV